MIRKDREDLAIKIFRAGCVETSATGFPLNLHRNNPGAPPSPIYFNTRTKDHPTKPGPVTQELLQEIDLHLGNLIEEDRIEFNCFAGVPYAANPFAEGLARRFGKKLIVLEKEPVRDSNRTVIRKILGKHPPAGSNVLLVENMLTRGGSAIEAAEFLLMACCPSPHLCTIIDWDGGAKKRFERAQLPMGIHSLFVVSDLIDFYERKGFVDRKLKERALDFAQFLRGLPG